MREIKFRVWHKKRKLLMYPGDNYLKEIYFNGEPFSKEYELMQYTGLKDKNSKEIYEGDIVKIDENHMSNILKFEENSKYTNGIVKWWNEGFAVCQKYIGATRLSEFATCHCCPCGLEIIGNVFENQELLNEPN